MRTSDVMGFTKKGYAIIFKTLYFWGGDFKMADVNYIGKASKYDIYNEEGLLIIPKFTKITAENIERLKQHHIKLSIEDLIETDITLYHDMVNETVNETRKIFDKVRQSMQ